MPEEQTTTWYYMSYGNKIEEVEVVRETKTCVFVASEFCRRIMQVKKHSRNHNYYPTRAEALAAMWKDVVVGLEQARYALSKARERVDFARETILASGIPLAEIGIESFEGGE